MGVITRPLTSGWTILPPALSEYAVDPVGVLIMRPSAEVEVRMRPDMDMVRCVRCGEAPR